MLNTGLFQFHEISGATEGVPESLVLVTAFSATCVRCGNFFSATGKPELETIQGGTIVNCPTCPSRQVISNARFDVEAGRLAVRQPESAHGFGPS